MCAKMLFFGISSALADSAKTHTSKAIIAKHNKILFFILSSRTKFAFCFLSDCFTKNSIRDYFPKKHHPKYEIKDLFFCTILRIYGNFNIFATLFLNTPYPHLFNRRGVNITHKSKFLSHKSWKLFRSNEIFFAHFLRSNEISSPLPAKNTIPLPNPTKKPAVGLVFLIKQNIVKKKH